MELDFHLPIGLATFTLFLYVLLRWTHKTETNNYAKKTPPETPGSWPLIGHLHLLGGITHLAMCRLSDKYGLIFMVWIGAHRGLVISTCELAKECLRSNDKAFLSRPKTIFVEHLGYDSAMPVFSPYGPYWRELRKMVTLKLLTGQRVQMWTWVRSSEIRSGVKAMHDQVVTNNMVDMKQWLNEVNLNIIVRLIVGKSLKETCTAEEYHGFQRVLRVWMDLAGVFAPGDAVPVLRWVDIGGYERAMKRIAREMDGWCQKWLQEHRRKRVSGEEVGGEKDFTDVMLVAYETGEGIPGFDEDTVLKATNMGMILAGTDTTAVTLTWALSLLLNNRHALEKAQAELDAHVGKQRQVNESDLKNLVYLQAIIKETMRLYPAAPLSVPRESIADCTVGGYHIPAGTRLFVNVYKIQRDPQVWPEPLEFRPERFLTTHKDVDVRGQHFELMPFGAGRRICPGITFALQSMQFTLASLLHGFEISTPGGEKVDMTEGFGLTNLKASPLEVILKPRLPDNLY